MLAPLTEALVARSPVQTGNDPAPEGVERVESALAHLVWAVQKLDEACSDDGVTYRVNFMFETVENILRTGNPSGWE